MATMEWDSLLRPSVHRQRRALFWFLLISSIYAFSPFHSSPTSCRIGVPINGNPLQSPRSRATVSARFDDDDDWLNAPDDIPSSFASSRSQIPQFIDAFLEKERETRGEVKPNKYTHMIGIPMAECHQLQIELESVQRAILYHCPSLIHACIVPTMSRMPLLYVDASREPAGSVTMELAQMVQHLVRQHCYVKESIQKDEDNNNIGRDGYDDISFSGLNAQGYKPLTMSFSRLQIDGQGNEALFTVADRDSAGGLVRLTAMAKDLRDAIEARGWKCRWPPSNVQGMREEEEEQARVGGGGDDAFLPRIALLRLPPNFETFLRPLVDDDDRRTSEDGGNGISPVFWIKWEKDVMGSHVRLREVGIYPRRPGFTGFDEQTFYLPHETVKLPDGNEALSQQEKIHRDYNEQRMKESERSLEELESGEVSPDGDFADPNLASDRQMLESIFGMSSEAFDNAVRDVMNDDDETYMPMAFDNGIGSPTNEVADGGQVGAEFKAVDVNTFSKSDDSQPENFMQDRIRNIVENRPSQQSKLSEAKAALPPLEENPVFKAYRDGTLVASDSGKGQDASMSDLPEILSEEHLRGFWKVVRSPLQMPDAIKDESRSDNFVLRVDGTVSGGPVLDQETFNKASGGTWRLIESIDEMSLRIRLVIPPKKDRIMVWEGQIFKDTESSFNSISILDATSFGKVVQDSNNEEIIKCSGQAWIEDAVTKLNRQDLGSFVLHKVNTSSEPRDFTITIPMSVRSQD